MRYTEDNGIYAICLEAGEELVFTLTNFCKEKKIEGGFFHGIGASDDLEIGYRSLVTKDYLSKRFSGCVFEITNLTGNVSKERLHIHITIGDSDMKAYTGHLISANVNPTLEVFLTPFKTLTRKMDEASGLALLDL